MKLTYFSILLLAFCQNQEISEQQKISRVIFHGKDLAERHQYDSLARIFPDYIFSKGDSDYIEMELRPLAENSFFQKDLKIRRELVFGQKGYIATIYPSEKAQKAPVDSISFYFIEKMGLDYVLKIDFYKPLPILKKINLNEH